jgi:hypothetical protein
LTDAQTGSCLTDAMAKERLVTGVSDSGPEMGNSVKRNVLCILFYNIFFFYTGNSIDYIFL